MKVTRIKPSELFDDIAALTAERDRLQARVRELEECERVIREEWHEDRTITIYPCPKCGNPEPDWDASHAYRMREMAKAVGWDQMSPLIDYFRNAVQERDRLRAALEKTAGGNRNSMVVAREALG